MFMNTKLTSFLSKYRTQLVIFVFFIATTLMQAVPGFVNLSHETKTGVYAVVLFLYFALSYFLLP